MWRVIIPLLLMVSLVGCAISSPPASLVNDTLSPTTAPTDSVSTQAPTSTNSPIIATQPLDTVVPTSTDELELWQTLPVIPTISPEMIEVYRRGQERGRDPRHFSKIGDCQNITTYYLAMFDSGSYSLGDQYAYLQPTIDYFKDSWWRESLAVKGGMNVAAVQNVLWANAEKCKKGETPLACEIRVHNPAFAIISLEESWTGSIERYDYYMRVIVDYVLDQDVVPIIATRAETLTQDRRINSIVAQIALDYNLPLWNFGAAAAALPDNGMRPDGFHLTEGRSYFDDPELLSTGWAQRNLTALQTLDSVLRGVGILP
jgi:hypothetical protein